MKLKRCPVSCNYVFFILVVGVSLWAEIEARLMFPIVDSNSNGGHVHLGDDGGKAFNMSTDFLFGGKSYRQIFVNHNGLVSFEGIIGQYTPNCSKFDEKPAIAPFWADVLTSKDLGGNIAFYETRDVLFLKTAQQVLESHGQINYAVELNWLFVATWSDVTYYNYTGSAEQADRNTFQLVLAKDIDNRSYAFFFYDKLTWISGTVSKNIPAKAGFQMIKNSESTNTFVHLPGSCSNAVTRLASEQPKIYRVDGFQVKQVNCDANKFPEIQPQFVDMFGHVELLITWPCFPKLADKVSCQFLKDDVLVAETSGKMTFNFNGLVPTVACKAPYFYETGLFKVDISISQSFTSLEPVFYRGASLNVVSQTPKIDIDLKSSLTTSSTSVEISWNPRTAEINGANFLRLTAIIFDLAKASWSNEPILSKNITNSGKFSISSTDLPQNSTVFESFYAFRLEAADSIFSEPVCGSLLFEGTDFLNHSASRFCEDWHSDKSSILSSSTCLLPCPPDISLARLDPRFELQPYYTIQMLNKLHPGGVASFRSVIPDAVTGSVQQCVYGPTGGLLAGPAEGGNVLGKSGNRIAFWKQDALPRCWCCSSLTNSESEFYRNCWRFYERRPSNLGFGYVPPPPPAVARGDPYITTFDNFTYTFNGRGDFLMVKTGTAFEMQARMERFHHYNATVFTAFAVRDHGTVFEIFRPKSSCDSTSQLSMKINGHPISPIGKSAQQFGNVFVTPLNNNFSEYSVAFRAGFTFRFSLFECAMAVVSIPTLSCGTEGVYFHGLLGSLDHNPENDLRSKSGSVLALNSTEREIHWQFGQTWRISDQENLFTIGSVDQTEPYNPVFVDEIVVNNNGSSLNGLDNACIELARERFGESTPAYSDAVLTNCERMPFAEETQNFKVAIDDQIKSVQVIVQVINSTSCSDFGNKELAKFRNGHYEATNGCYVGSKIQFFCDDGYEFENEQLTHIECRKVYDQNQWTSHNIPSCKKRLTSSGNDNSTVGETLVNPSVPHISRYSDVCWCCITENYDEERMCCSTQKCNGPPGYAKCENRHTDFCESLKDWRIVKPICKSPMYPCKQPI